MVPVFMNVGKGLQLKTTALLILFLIELLGLLTGLGLLDL